MSSRTIDKHDFWDRIRTGHNDMVDVCRNRARDSDRSALIDRTGLAERSRYQRVNAISVAGKEFSLLIYDSITLSKANDIESRSVSLWWA
jgi:hypothetical protein